jgi:Cu/Zn superoxide dismutase
MKHLIALLLVPFVACAPAPNAGGAGNASTSSEVVSARNLAIVPVGTNAAKSRVQGRIEVATQLDGKTRVTMSILGLDAGSSHAVHLHAGTCTQPGAIRLALTEIVATSSGGNISSSTFDTSRIPSSAYLMIHERASNASNGPGPGMACANIR